MLVAAGYRFLHFFCSHCSAACSQGALFLSGRSAICELQNIARME